MRRRVRELGEGLGIFSRPRSIRWILLVWALAVVALLLIGSTGIDVPQSVTYEQRPTLLLWRMIVPYLAIAPTVLLHSPFGELERALPSRWRRTRLLWFTATHLVGLGVLATTMGLGVDAAATPLAVRGYAGWAGAALLSAVLFSLARSWILPAMLLPVILFWGAAPDGTYRWWDFTIRSWSDPRPWLIVAAFWLTAGGIAGLRGRWFGLASVRGALHRVPRRS